MLGSEPVVPLGAVLSDAAPDSRRSRSELGWRFFAAAAAGRGSAAGSRGRSGSAASPAPSAASRG